MWYAYAVAILPSRPMAFAAPWVRRTSAFIRWRLRALLRPLPARTAAPHAVSREWGVSGRKHRIAYLFAGTFGDFAQVLRPLNRLASAFPRSEIILWGGGRYLRDFASELPASLRAARTCEPGRWLFDPVDIVFVNCVGVYRVRFDLVAGLCSRAAFGFRHSHEEGRGGYRGTLPLGAGVRSFAQENLKLLDLAGVPDPVGPAGMAPGRKMPGGPVPAGEPSWGRGKILFLIGSAGLKRDFGFETYARLVTAILAKLATDGPLEVVYGPGDEDVVRSIRAVMALEPAAYPLPMLILRLSSFEGTILCFNSFSAHLCHYLGLRALVLHREAVPYGYDCSPLHRQIVLRSERNWDLGDLWKALETARYEARPAGP